MRKLSIFRYMPQALSRRLIRRIVQRNFDAAAQCAALVYFPPVLLSSSAALIAKLQLCGVTHVSRYDIDFDSVAGRSRALRPAGDRLVAISAVRFLYRTFSEATEEYSKGNDIMVRGFAKYQAKGADFKLHLFEKGEDVDLAKDLIRELGLQRNVTWHQQVPFDELLSKIEASDVYIDQLGNHIMGTGMYAMYLGRPVIANTEKLTFLGEHPVLHAATPEELAQRLAELEDPTFRADVAQRSRAFAEHRFSVADTVDRLLQVPTRTD